MPRNDREARIEVFEDTLSQCRHNERLKAAVKASLADQQLILEEDVVAGLASENRTACSASGSEAAYPAGGDVYGEDARIVVSQKRTLEAAQGYKGQRVCVLNFASATNPGGGVTRGSSAQEECLCRCSTLYPCISEKSARAGFHDRHRRLLADGKMDVLYNDDCIYTPGVVVFKSDTGLPQTLPESQWYCVDVITCAAPNLRENPSNSMNPGSSSRAVKIKDSALAALHEKRADRILKIAKAHHAQVVILGAFGCGAFQNPPAVVAAGIWEAVKRHRRDFAVIEFAVYCSPRDTGNYDAFRRRFQ
ncbi:MAG: TIGR02452 family protein [Lachnospiraceae bacterium]|nr:TIGR02452 family protein [Lachnospiraceae bacterium]